MTLPAHITYPTTAAMNGDMPGKRDGRSFTTNGSILVNVTELRTTGIRRGCLPKVLHFLGAGGRRERGKAYRKRRVAKAVAPITFQADAVLRHH